MAKRKKPIKRGGPKIMYCANCGKSVDSMYAVWSWKEGPSIYCSDRCKEELEGTKSAKES